MKHRSLRIVPTLTIRNESQYLVGGARVSHSTPPDIEADVVYCWDCDTMRCDHADALRLALINAKAAP